MGQANYVNSGEVIDYTPVAAKSAGDVVVQNGYAGVAPVDLPADVLGSLRVGGAHDFVKVTGAISAGNAVYWDADADPVSGTAGTGAATTTSSGNTFLGWATEAAGSSDTRVRVQMVKVLTLTAHQPLTNAIADPGNGGAIPVTVSGYCPIVTAGSETRTLAVPTFIGQELLLYIKTDGGTCVITVASAINQTGNNTITMADVRDAIRLIAIESGSNKVWHVVSNDGAALSTV